MLFVVCFFYLLNFYLLLIYFIIIFLIEFVLIVCHIEHAHVKTNLVHQLYHVQAIRVLPIKNFKDLLTHDQYKSASRRQLQRDYRLYMISS